MTTWIAVVLVGLGSYAFRVIPMLVGGRARRPGRVDRAIDHAGLAALTALVVAGVQDHDGGGRPGAALWAVAAVIAGTAVARRGGSMLAVVVAGLGSYWLLTLLVASVP